jgi:16S rRNA (guanine(1405)-N(7))-methyltransferase
MPTDLDSLIAQIMQSKKYRDIGVAEDTIRDILITELARQPNEKAAMQSARKKLHEVIALYLGDPDYERAYERLKAAYGSGDEDEIKETCADIMRDHDSTRERLPLLESFYARIFEITGTPRGVLDIACALNPLTIPWMNLPGGAVFYGYDIHQQRMDFLSRYFALLPGTGITARAIMRDILVHYPQESGDVALLLKEIHRMEKRRRGIVLPLLDALDVRWIVLSSPTHSRTGRHSTIDAYRRQVHGIIADRPWPVTEIEFDNELIYCIQKRP